MAVVLNIPVGNDDTGNALLLRKTLKVIVCDNPDILRRLTFNDFVVELPRHVCGSDNDGTGRLVRTAKRSNDRSQNDETEHQKTGRSCGRGIAGRQHREDVKEKSSNQQSCTGGFKNFLNEDLRLGIDEKFIDTV